ncbi:hypothetical protein FPOA_12963 [Fusarium poae]|uniref:Uncharacterized protein n=1 Tax=Fusarium poae TaxID=36050 RepID=A0A1B8A7D0_FUSPO|nr:hypothetical protein FPOA_12963 [Fusarium poae]
MHLISKYPKDVCSVRNSGSVQSRHPGLDAYVTGSTGLDRPAVQRAWTEPPALTGLVPRSDQNLVWRSSFGVVVPSYAQQPPAQPACRTANFLLCNICFIDFEDCTIYSPNNMGLKWAVQAVQ